MQNPYENVIAVFDEQDKKENVKHEINKLAWEIHDLEEQLQEMETLRDEVPTLDDLNGIGAEIMELEEKVRTLKKELWG